MRKNMEQIVALAKRRGFIFQSSEIYGGLQGFWDYGPLGVELKRNVREAWWRDMITLHDETAVPAGAPRAFQMVGLETSIIMHPQVWKCSGHYDLFHDMKVDCTETKKRYRFDQIRGRWLNLDFLRSADASRLGAIHPQGRMYKEMTQFDARRGSQAGLSRYASWRFFFASDADDTHAALEQTVNRACKLLELRPKEVEEWIDPFWESQTLVSLAPTDDLAYVIAPEARYPGTLTEPREFNLMLESHTGAVRDESNRVFLRPETAQGMFVNFKNVLDSTRVKVPFGIAQVGKSFRNEITPRNFTFRSREFEQMEMEFFCHPSESRAWYEYWRNRRLKWYADLGIISDSLRLREHGREELSHYSVGTADVEYAFPFLEPGEYGELEGVAHRGDFDLRSHMEGKLVKDESGCLVVEQTPGGEPKYRGSGKDLSYFDDQTRERFVPHVIEPAAGADRATLAFLCEAYDEDEQPDEKGQPQKRTLMRFHPRLAPVKAAVFPLIKKDGMPETAIEIFRKLKAAGIASVYDQQAAIGRRYRRQDEVGTPYCITVDGETASDGRVTVRDRDTLEQERVPVGEVVEVIRERLGTS